jgi:hypothetical protein
MSEESDSLISALKKAGIPAGNHDFIRDMVNAVGIAEFRVVDESESYVIAVRRDGRADLHIHWGYTTGFASEEEIIATVGPRFGRAPSSRKGFWYVEHALTKVGSGGERSKDVRREANFCSCGMQLSVSGICASCD